MYENIQPAPPDAILGLTEAWKADPNPNKINLGVGVFKDETGATPILRSVKKAEARLLETEQSKGYMPISGSPDYARLVQGLIFESHPELMEEKRVQTLHSPGGTGALRVGGDFLRGQSAPTIWVSTPTWANHKGIFTAAGCPLRDYPYYDPASKALDFDAMLATLKEVPAGDVVLLHVCCHNPTGVDVEGAQWEQVAEVAAERGWLPYFDFAYQGFGDGLAEDAAALSPFVSRGLEFLIASSFSKNLGLYGERTGALSVVGRDADSTSAAFSHMKAAVRTNYSNPPTHGGALASIVLGDEALRAEWVAELDEMRNRIRDMRAALVAGLASRKASLDFSFIERQRGMFSFTALVPEQVQELREKNSIYVVKGGGRINVAGITPGNIDYLCDALVAVL